MVPLKPSWGWNHCLRTFETLASTCYHSRLFLRLVIQLFGVTHIFCLGPRWPDKNKHGLRIWDRIQLHRADRLWIMKRLHKDGPAPLKYLPATTKWSLNLRNGGRKGYRYSIFLEEGMTPLSEEPEKQRETTGVSGNCSIDMTAAPFKDVWPKKWRGQNCVWWEGTKSGKCPFASPSVTRIPNWRLDSEMEP